MVLEKRMKRGMIMEKRRGEVMKMVSCSGLGVLLVALLHLPMPTSAQNNTTNTPLQPSSQPVSPVIPMAGLYSTRPGNLTVAAGEPAVFRCGASPAPSQLTLTLYGSRRNYSLICPGKPMDDIPEALHGSCEKKNGELVAMWTISGTSYHDNGTRVVCKQSDHPDELVAFLHVYDNGTSFALLIGCVIGGFFGILLVFGLSWTIIWRSETLQKCFIGGGGGGEEDDDVETIVTKD